MTAAAGFLFGSKWQGGWSNFVALLVGSTLVIASACVFNNYFDRSLDSKMTRTKKRSLVTREITPGAAIVYASLLGITGFAVLAFTNFLTVCLMILGFVGYVGAYTIAKHHTVHSTLIGTIPGGVSLVAGYVAAVNRLDLASFLLFLIMLGWQMVHFYAIAIYRLQDYKTAALPIVSVKKGIEFTKRFMLAYLLIFIAAALSLTFFGFAGYIYLVIVAFLGLSWLWLTIKGFSTTNNNLWARQMFKYSLTVILIVSILLSVGSALP